MHIRSVNRQWRTTLLSGGACFRVCVTCIRRRTYVLSLRRKRYDTLSVNIEDPLNERRRYRKENGMAEKQDKQEEALNARSPSIQSRYLLSFSMRYMRL